MEPPTEADRMDRGYNTEDTIKQTDKRHEGGKRLYAGTLTTRRATGEVRGEGREEDR